MEKTSLPLELTKGHPLLREIGVGNFVVQRWEQRFPSIKAPRVPEHARWWRLNLSAISQRFNLYFSALGANITITIPRDLKQTLPGKADLVLELPITSAGVRLGGLIDENEPHCVNNIKVGNLGNLEVLLIACDDGDVVAYYTHLFVDEIRKIRLTGDTKPLPSTLKPFFHENVGCSSWGLALHENSRLIGVSSNLRQITIFVHGHTAFADDEYVRAQEDGFAAIVYSEKLREVEQQTTECICKENFRTLPFPHTGGQPFHNYRMILPLGEDGHNIPSIDFVSDDDGIATHVLAVDINGNLWVFNLSTGARQCHPGLSNLLDGHTMGWGVLCIPIHYFKRAPTLGEALLLGTEQSPAGNNDREKLPPGHAILRTYNHDVELLPPDDPQTPRTFFRAIIRQNFRPLRLELRALDRLNMLTFIPELSLIIASSQIGRVALITPTTFEGDFMFRLDLLLPLQVHEDEHRPNVPLSGLAVSPLQASTIGRRGGWQGQKRWRLLMHYINQTVLSYELFRDEDEQLNFL